jgi:hypothetical protein
MSEEEKNAELEKDEQEDRFRPEKLPPPIYPSTTHGHLGGAQIRPANGAAGEGGVHAKTYIILCSQYVESGVFSTPFSCATVGVIYADANMFVAAAMQSSRMSNIDINLQGGDIQPIALFTVRFLGSMDSRSPIRSLIQSVLASGPNSYSVRLLPGGSVLAQRSYVPDEIVKSIWNTRAWYENTWLRFDLVDYQDINPNSETGFISMFLSMVVEHSKTPDLAPEHWHPASAEESLEYQKAIIARLEERIRGICTNVPDGDGEMICKPGFENAQLLTRKHGKRKIGRRK